MLAITTGAFLTLIGIIYRRLRCRVKDVEDRLDTHDGEVTELSKWAFGIDSDETSGGLAQNMDERFDSLDSQIDDLQDAVETRHVQNRERIEQLIDALEDDEELGFDRGDLDD
jgi:hypothetical protein